MVVEIVLSIAITFVGMFLASKLTSFQIHNGQLAIVAAAGAAAGFIPSIGWIVSLVVVFALLKYFSNSSGVILMIIVSWLMSVLSISALGQLAFNS